MKLLGLALWLSVLVSGETLRIQVLGLFHPEEVIVYEGTAHHRTKLLRRKMNAGQSVTFIGPVSLEIPSKITRRYQGPLHITAAGSELQIVIEESSEHAVQAAVAAEAQTSDPPEALKAMAILARSNYAAGPRHYGAFDFCDTTHCQFHREVPLPGTPAASASQATAGRVLTYRQQVFAPLYSAACGGQTRTAAEVGLERQDGTGYGYFPIVCEECRRHAVRWSRKLRPEVFGSLRNGPSELLRVMLNRNVPHGLPSNHYEFHQEGETILVNGAGNGHGVGYCQAGGAALARRGMSASEVIAYYLPNTALTYKSSTDLSAVR